ncbi:Crp/Fnr family transcriptional regulator [Methyloceanibacter caenitepidi]|uniref:cAMP-binding proteins-catabolite gene activator and regulatory subunit of cAMP-dependent protein kinases n=1 Tax=Methyloceanibacter caenitepidi TaxID=1384459 RepID=A0A0A8K5H4_9HYPH|nr:Crp/Fnr family transcriptional regulator [Methyloceanibacter caenitepidi]BAQ18198.1 cAMP-binding proteins - catabolite gene activator and regulatory subunit of cAMP-dependent protein kinases [Methyloceanibacter caenitepidi]
MKKDAWNLERALEVLCSRGWLSERGKEIQKRLAGIARLRIFEAHEPIYLAGQNPNGVFGLVEGSVKLAFPRNDGEDYIAHYAGTGFWFGDLALFSNAPRLVSIHAAEPTTMVQLSPQGIARLVREDPKLHADFYALTYANFRTALSIIANLAIVSVDKRIADRLLLEAAAHPKADGWVHVSQPDLAQLMAVSVPTLRRTIGRFVRAGLVEQGYGRIKVVDANGLQNIIRG